MRRSVRSLHNAELFMNQHVILISVQITNLKGIRDITSCLCDLQGVPWSRHCAATLCELSECIHIGFFHLFFMTFYFTWNLCEMFSNVQSWNALMIFVLLLLLLFREQAYLKLQWTLHQWKTMCYLQKPTSTDRWDFERAHVLLLQLINAANLPITIIKRTRSLSKIRVCLVPS